ncbi:MAG: cation:proton antiporter [Elusimicrobia bacterium]|nr:cation:proton antiporter [Elusimicrobiota bacterium]
MHEPNVSLFLANLIVILMSAKLFGELAERLGQPAVLGELLGGVLLGLGLVGFFHANDPALNLMSELGVVILLFETGINSDLDQLLRAGPVSFAVACVGVTIPFILGWGVMHLVSKPAIECIFVGAAMTATSVGITARVLADMGKLSSREAQIVLGAAVIDDILGLIILAAVEGIARSGSVSWLQVGRITVMACAFLGVALWLGPGLSKRLIKLVRMMRVRGILIVTAVCFAFAMALLAQELGTALIVGAFTAGILLARTDKREDIDGALKPVADIFVPIFFVMVGAKVNLSTFDPRLPGAGELWALAAAISVLAVVGKVLAGWAAWGEKLNKLGIGVAMMPRGEVGLIFAQIGLAARVIEPPLYAAVVAMVVVTTFLSPPLLTKVFD